MAPLAESTQLSKVHQERDFQEGKKSASEVEKSKAKAPMIPTPKQQSKTPFSDLGELTLKGKGSFRTRKNHHWTSNQAALTFRGEGNRTTQEIRLKVVKRWPQSSKHDKKQSAEPKFAAVEMTRLQAYATEIFLNRLNGRPPPNRDPRDPPPQYEEDKEHLTKLCKYCEFLGYNCTRRRVG
jgi:hypothetical protein